MKYLMIINKKFIAVFFLLSIMSQAIAQATTENIKPLMLATMDLPPYGWVDEQGKPHGIIYELTEEIGKRSGLPYTHKIRPFSRMLLELKAGKVDLLSSQAHQRALNAGDKLAVQFNIDVIAGTKKDSGIQQIQDFRDKNMIYHQSASYPQLDGMPRDIIFVKGYQQILQMLHQRPNVHGAVFSEPAYYYWMKEISLSPTDFGNVVTIEANKEQWIFVRKDYPEELRKKIQHIVEEIHKEGMYELLLKKYGKK